VLSTERSTVAVAALLPAGVTTVFLNPTFPAGALAAALAVDQIHELPVRERELDAGMVNETPVPHGPAPYFAAA